MVATRTERDEAYKNASVAVQRMCNDPESGDQLFAIAKRHDITQYDRTYRAYALAVGDVALGFFSERELPDVLATEADLDPETAHAIADDLHDFFAPLYSDDSQGFAVPIQINGTGSADAPAMTGDTAIRWESERTEIGAVPSQPTHPDAASQTAVSGESEYPPATAEPYTPREEPSHHSHQDDSFPDHSRRSTGGE